MKKQVATFFLFASIIFIFPHVSMAFSVTPTSDANTLINNIVGSGITITGAQSYTGVTNQSATFTGGIASGVGFESGILLTSGNVNNVPGPNSNTSLPETRGSKSTNGEDISTNLNTSGYAPLSTIAGYQTYDAATLGFNFQFGDGSVGGNLYFNFAFASEEYVNFVGSQYNDVFAFFVDGVNVGLIPGTSTPITVNTVNDLTNSAYYKNNVANTNGIPNLGLDLSFDGLTYVITCQALGLAPGQHSMLFAIADTSDHILDAGVFIQAGSFSPDNPVPLPSSILFLGSGLVGFAGYARWRLKK